MFGSTMCNSLTFVHFVEEQIGINYRYLKKFTGEYINERGEKTIKSYYMNVRDLSLNIKMTSENFAPLFYKIGALTTKEFDNFSISVVDLNMVYPVIANDIIYNKSRTFCRYGRNTIDEKLRRQIIQKLKK
jgi:aminoglycoside 3-N-acetyltransferase